MRRFKYVALAMVLLSLVVSVLCSACQNGSLPGFSMKAPELAGGKDWLNTDKPLTLNELRGKIVLLDFWNLSCVNCFHTLPLLKSLEEHYGNKLVVIGIHSPKYSNERDPRLIREAVRSMEMDHPVVNDAEDKIWLAYGIKAYPTFVLIDPKGNLVKMMVGERSYASLENTLKQLVADFSQKHELDETPLKFVSERSRVTDTPLLFPEKLCIGPNKNELFISDAGHNRIVVCDLSGKLKYVIGCGKRGAKNGSYAEVQFNHPRGLAIDGTALYVADTQNHMIRKIDLLKKNVSTICGDGHKTLLEHSNGGKLTEVELNSPWDLVAAGNKLYIAMAGSHQIWALNFSDGTIAPYAGSGIEELHDAELLKADLAQPSGIATDGKNLYFADSESSAVRSAPLQGGSVKTLVGQGLSSFGDTDGSAKTALLQHPVGIGLAPGKLIVADTLNHKIKTLDLISNSISTTWGSGKPGYNDGEYPQFNEPNGLACAGNLVYIADTGNNAIRVGNLDNGQLKTLKVNGLSPLVCEPVKVTGHSK